MHLSVLAVFLMALGLLVSTPAIAYPDGPEPRLTGGQGYADCSECHFAGPAPTQGNGVKLQGLVEQLVPGERYQWVLEVRDPAQRVGGFQLAVRDLDTQQSVGELVFAEGLRVVNDQQVTFLSHSEPKVAQAKGDYQVTRWEFEWVAEQAARIEVSVAAVAADGDDSALGDNVYTFSRIILTN